jgi:3-hydroxybutyrate dehydrogenase
MNVHDERRIATLTKTSEDVRRRVAVVTGAGSGIGRAVAEGLAADGMIVVCADIRLGSAEEVAASVGGLALEADVASADACQALIDTTVERLGRIDVLVNNAGLQHVSPVEAFPPERWELIIRIMLVGPFYLTRAALPHMYRQDWGRIINMASVHALVASPNKSAYVAAKHGLLGLTKTVALEAARRGVTVNAICPSFVRTPLVGGQLAGLAQAGGISEAEALEQVVLGSVPARRLLEPEEIAASVRYLCSDAAAGITGSSLVIDGGWTAR